MDLSPFPADDLAEIDEALLDHLEQSPWRGGCVGDGTEAESEQESQRDERQDLASGECTLGNRISSADQLGRKPGEGAHGGTDQSGTQMYGQHVQALGRLHRGEQRSVVGDRKQARNTAESEEQRPRPGGPILERTNMEVRRIPQ